MHMKVVESRQLRVCQLLRHAETLPVTAEPEFLLLRLRLRI